MGATFATVTLSESDAVWSAPSVTVRVTVYVPSSANACAGAAPVEVSPSPKFHANVTAPSRSLLLLPSNVNADPSSPLRSSPARATGTLSRTVTTTSSVAVFPT